MSNLSDLIPAGGGQNNPDFVADGAIASGKPVILTAAGKAAEVGGTAASAGTPVDFGAAGVPDYVNAAYDTSANKVVVTFMDLGNSDYGTAVVGTVSGTAISWGTPVVFNSGESIDNRIAYDSDASKVVVAFRDGSAGNYGKAVVGTVSGTSISFGSEVDFNAASTTNIGIGFDSTANKVVIAFRDDGNSEYGTAVVGTVSGTSISFGSEAVFQSSITQNHSVVYDSNADKTVIVYKHNGNSSYGTATVCTVSGTSITFGTAVVFKTASTTPYATFDSSSNKVVIPYAISGAGKGVVGTVSGTSISFGAEAEFSSTEVNRVTCAYDSSANKTVVGYSEEAVTFDGTAVSGTVSGTDITFDSPFTFAASITYKSSATVYDSNANKIVFAYRQASVGGDGVVYTLSTYNLTASNLLGVASGAILDTATGTINTWGSMNEVQTSLTIASDYYVQEDGTITTTSTSPAQLLGKALSATMINIKDYTG